MNNWVIDKAFKWEMAHRVWTQVLGHEHLSIDTECKCKHLHGHSYTVKIFLGANKLDDTQMVTDFKNLNFMKQFIDSVLDHKFMIDVNDPNFQLITGCVSPSRANDTVSDGTNLSYIFPSAEADIQLHRASFILVNFVPTSENICKYLYDYAAAQLENVANVVAVELWETEKSHCRYVA